MIACSTLLNAWAIVAVMFGIGERIYLQRLVDRSSDIVVGASEKEVLGVLGEPLERWDARAGGTWPLFGGPARWLYGTTVDLEFVIVAELPFPNPIPINLRIFSPSDDDLVIEWTPDKKVAQLSRPELQIPSEIEKLFEPICLMVDCIRFIEGK